MFKRSWIVAAFVVLFCVPIASAQDVCEPLVESAISQIGQNCAGLARNQVCYGFDQVRAEFFNLQPVNFFSTPADVESLGVFRTVRTGPLDVEREEWGVVVMNVQANVPNTLPGQGVVFVLVGDVRIDEATPVQNIIVSGEPRTVTTAEPVTLHREPDLTSGVVTLVNANTDLFADSISADGEWVRVLFDEEIVWMPVSALGIVEALNLPILNESARTSMQAFYFTGGLGAANCNAAPDVMAIQSPDNLSVELTVNGLDVSIGSTITIVDNNDGTLTFTAHEGTLTVDEDGTVYTTGQSLDAILDDTSTITSWSAPRPATVGELALANTVGPILTSLENPASTTTTTVDNTSVPARNRAAVDGFYTVQRGDNLFRIALANNTCVSAIANANNITDVRRIYAGTRLAIPDGSMCNGPTNDVTVTVYPSQHVPSSSGMMPAEDAVCATLQLTSPLDGMNFGRQDFYWNGVTGATSYRVVVFDDAGIPVASGTTSDTNIHLDTGSDDRAGGVTYSWQVTAFTADGNTLCTAGPVSVPRGAA